jgi:transcriptional regulator with XRE-family HTH domain
MSDTSLAKGFGRLIRQLRRERGLSQEDFADLCGLHRTYVGSIERGEKAVTIVTASKIAEALGIPLSQVFLLLEVEQKSNDDDN